MGLFDGIVGSVISGALGFMGQEDTNEAQIEQAQKQMDFQERMSNTAHQREVKDLRAAGLNPILSAKLGGASTPQGAQATIGNSAAAGVNSSAVAANIAKTKEETKNVAADTKNKEVNNELIGAQIRATLASAGQLEATEKRLQQEIQAWIDQGNEIQKIERDYKWYQAAEQRTKSDVAHASESYQVAQHKEEARRLKTLADLLGLEIPAALNEAAYESSTQGKTSRYLDRGVNTLGNVVGSASGLKNLTRQGITTKYTERKGKTIYSETRSK
jgi:hypothetical protein